MVDLRRVVDSYRGNIGNQQFHSACKCAIVSIVQPGIPKVEIIRYAKIGEEYHVQLAVDGVLAVPQEVHASIREERFTTEESWMEYLTRSAMTLIQVFGDARDNRIVNEMEMEGAAA